VAQDLHQIYDELVQFASMGPRAEALTAARKAFIHRTGDLFESDDGFERRICAFLEWYTLDCVQPDGQTLLTTFAAGMAEAERAERHGGVLIWQHAAVSLFEVAKVRASGVVLSDLLLSQQHTITGGPQLVGLCAKDIIIARVVNHPDGARLTEGISFFAPAARKVLLRIAKAYRKGQVPGVSRLDLLHRLIYLTNRCERYRHVDPKRIFAEGEASVTQAPSAG
jgi:hypothetical protein